MKLVKMLSLAAIAATAATAFVGTSSASAFHFHAYCSTPDWLCNLTNWISLPGRWVWVQGAVEQFKGTLSEECGESKAESNEGKKELLDEGPMAITLETFTFSGCKPCTSVKATTPIKAEIFMMSENEKETPNWLVTLKEFTVTFEGCPLGLKCKFGSSEFTGILEMGGKEPVFNTNGAKLSKKEGGELCGTSVQWEGLFGWRWKLDNNVEEVIWPALLI